MRSILLFLSLAVVINTFFLPTQPNPSSPTLESNDPVSNDLWTYKGTFEMSAPAFIETTRFDVDKSSDPFLLISTFSALPFKYGEVYAIENIKESILNDQIDKVKPIKLMDGFKWPNKVDTVPYNVFSKRAIIVPDGFIMITHKTGAIYILTLESESETFSLSDAQVTKYKITKDKQNYFYHTGEWHDFNGDGRLDLLTARTDGAKGDGQLVWLEHPEGGLESNSEWVEHVIVEGPDVLFLTLDSNKNSNTLQIIATEFWNQKLTAIQINKSTGELIKRSVIDDTLGYAYAVKAADLNGDGKVELVVNNHQMFSKDSAVFIYEMPSDDVMDITGYTRHTAASDFPVQWGIATMAPGFVYPVWPYAKDEGVRGKKADMLIAGDGDFRAHLLEYQSDWQYKNDEIRNENGTVGSIAYEDVTGDGWTQFFVANYDKGYVEVYTFNTEKRKEERMEQAIDNA